MMQYIFRMELKSINLERSCFSLGGRTQNLFIQNISKISQAISRNALKLSRLVLLSLLNRGIFCTSLVDISNSLQFPESICGYFYCLVRTMKSAHTLPTSILNCRETVLGRAFGNTFIPFEKIFYLMLLSTGFREPVDETQPGKAGIRSNKILK